ncbi:MAG: hypothetical protein Ta2G_11380 [Termitinemataceae bacterium]|nr:MAG: hypothetical protein Ta2G_11380 [Termitinemataceae bacterium]
MKLKRTIFFILLFCLSVFLNAQERLTVSYKSSLNKGIELYSLGNWIDAVRSFRDALRDAATERDKSEAQFWIAMTELSAGQFNDAFEDLDDILRMDPNSPRASEIPYQKARALFYLKRYDEAIPLFRAYSDNIPSIETEKGLSTDDAMKYKTPSSNYNKKAAAIYWIGECYYSLGDFDRAEDIFDTIVGYYTKSFKYESSANRIALIRQKKVERELLELLRSSKTEQAADSDTFSDVIEIEVPSYIQKNNKTQNDNKSQTDNKPQTDNKNESKNTNTTGGNDSDVIMRLLSIKTSALEMMDRLVSSLKAYEGIDSQEW